MEEIKKIEVQGQQYGVADMLMRGVMGGNAQVIEWSYTHNMNDYKVTGTYRIKGERTGNPMTDNLPIMNQGSGHTIEGILYVLDSSLSNGSGKESDCTITQFLMLSNRVGGQEGDMYMRSAYGTNKDSLTWKPWEKYQTNIEVGVVSNEKVLNPSNPTQALADDGGMNFCIDNGIYSGVYTDDGYYDGRPGFLETFTLVVINNYAVAGQNSALKRTISQLKYAVDALTNQVSIRQRTKTDGGNWSDWKDISNLAVDDKVTNTSVNPVQSQAIAKAIAEAEKRALRKLFIAAGAEYNDTDQVIKKVAPWGTEEKWEQNADGTYRYWEEEAVVDHLPGHYYLNGLGDITEKQMMNIYNRGYFNDNDIAAFADSHGGANKIRTNLLRAGLWNGTIQSFLCSYNSVIETVTMHTVNTGLYDCKISISDSEGLFESASNLSVIDTRCVLNSSLWTSSSFKGCKVLKEVRIVRLKSNISFANSPLLSKASVLYMIEKATATSAIAITLHHDAYVRLAENQEVLDVLDTKNTALAGTGGKISLVCATHSE